MASGDLNRWVRNSVLTGGLAMLAYLASGAVSERDKKLERSHELAVKAITKTSEQSTDIAVIKSEQAVMKADMNKVNDKLDRLIELQWQTLSAAKRLESR